MNREELIKEFWKNDALLDDLKPGSEEYQELVRVNRGLCDRITGDQ